MLEIEFSATLHDREIRIDNGWVVKIGRGLDFYQKPTSWFEIGPTESLAAKVPGDEGGYFP